MKISLFPPRSKWWGDVSVLVTVKDFGHLWYNKPRGYLPPTPFMYYGKNVAISRGWLGEHNESKYPFFRIDICSLVVPMLVPGY